MNKDIPLRREDTLRAVLWGGLLCGVLDIAYAIALYGMLGIHPVRLLQGIASGIMGPSAFTHGLSTAAYGLLLHFVIAFGAATVYALASRKLVFMVRHAVRAGMVYGIAVHLFMNFIVLPLSNVHHRPFQPGVFFVNMLEHIFLVGLPIALAVQRLSSQSNEVVLSQSDVEVDSKVANA